MKKLILLFLVLVVDITSGFAQFEGEFTFRSYVPGQMDEPSRYMNIYVTPQRLLMVSDETYPVMRGLHTNSILIRNDEEDFIFKTSENEGIQITKDDVDGLTSILSGFSGFGSQGSGGFDWARVEETGETRVQSGYPAYQFLVHDTDENSYISVWLTDRIKINWGVLNEVWTQSISTFIQADLPIEVFMNANSFPLMIEYIRDDQVISVVEAVHVSQTTVDESIVSIPDNMSLGGFSELVMRMMRNRP